MGCSKIKRKLIKHGPSSYIVSLPLNWIKKHSLQKGDEVDLLVTGSDIRITSMDSESQDAVEINLDKTKDLTEWIIYSLYKRGIDEVRIRYSDQKYFNLVLEAIAKDAINYEIIETTKNGCTIKSITRLTNEFDTILRRVFLITISMAEEGLKAIRDGHYDSLTQINLLERSNNKLATYCRRYINKHGIEKYDRAGPLYFVVEQLEKIADEYRYLFDDMKALHNGAEISASYLDLHDRIYHMLRLFYECFYKFDYQKLNQLNDERLSILAKLEDLFQKTDDTISFHLYRHAIVLVEKIYSMVDPYLILSMKK